MLTTRQTTALAKYRARCTELGIVPGKVIDTGSYPSLLKRAYQTERGDSPGTFFDGDSILLDNLLIIRP